MVVKNEIDGEIRSIVNKFLLTHCGLVYHMALKKFVNIGYGSGSCPEDTKPLAKPTLTNYQWGPLAFTWEQFRLKCSRHISLIWV